MKARTLTLKRWSFSIEWGRDDDEPPEEEDLEAERAEQRPPPFSVEGFRGTESRG